MWLVGDSIDLRKVARRFKIEIDGRRTEIAAIKTRLIVIDGEFKISTRAIELAMRHDIAIVKIGNPIDFWIYKTYPKKDVSLLLRQFEVCKYMDTSELEQAIIHNINSLFSRLGIKRVYSVDSAVEEFVHTVELKRGVNPKDVERYLKSFLIAESLDFVLKSGLEPSIGIRSSTIAEDMALPLIPISVWYTILVLDFIPTDLKVLELRRSILRKFKNVLKRPVENVHGVVKPIITHLKLQVEAFASSLRNPMYSFEFFRVGDLLLE